MHVVGLKFMKVLQILYKLVKKKFAILHKFQNIGMHIFIVALCILYSLTQNNTLHTPIARRTLSSVQLTQ